MSLHVLSHPWEVEKVADGTVVTITRRDLDVATLSILADELCELALDATPPTLYLDFGGVSCLSGVVCGKLLALERRLHERGGRLVLRNLNLPREEAPTDGGVEDSTPE